MARVIVGLNKIDLEIYLCKQVIQGHAFIWPHLRLATWGLTEYFLLTALAFSRHRCVYAAPLLLKRRAPVKRHLYGIRN